MKEIFLIEARELLDSLEGGLLTLETNPDSTETIEAVFRDMHTLKGASGMFGLDNMAAFIHNLESLYDLIRNETIKLSKEMLNASLSSIDHIQNLLEDPKLENENNKLNQEELTKKILTFLSVNSDTDNTQNVNEIETINEDSEINTYLISFIPNPTIFDNGTNPLFILDELCELGKAEVFPYFNELSNFSEFIPTKCNSFWDIVLATEKNENEIRDTFLFVEDESKISINVVCEYNFLESEKWRELVRDRVFSTAKPFNLEDLKKLTISETPVKNDTITNLNKVLTKKKEKSVSSIRVASDKLDELMSIVSELVTTQAGLSLYSETNQAPELETISENVEKLSRQLRDVAFSMTLIPINNMFGRFQRMVRDIANELGKNVQFVTEGGETEMDKSIIESLTDPLMHLLRNSLDHGIESNQDRILSGKPEQGTIKLKAYYSGAYVHIEIKDDGKGIDPSIIREKAIQKGIITNETVLSNKEIFDLIFTAGFSTAAKITDVSGRGVGMDVVKKNILNLRGEVLVDSDLGQGTTITIKLPLTLSIIDGLLVKLNEMHYVIPLSVVDKCFEITTSSMTENFNNLLTLDGDQVPFINLRKEFSITDTAPELSQLIVVNNGEKRVGLSVDFIVGEYQAVLKPLGKYYRNQDFISGGTILGDGTIALVMDTNKIISQITDNLILAEQL